MIVAREFCFAAALTLASSTLSAQAPRPFPQPTPPPVAPTPAPPSSPTAKPATAEPATARNVPDAKPATAEKVPDEASLGVPLYPNAQFIASYDAGRGQRFYLFGVGSSFADMVNYYRAALKQKGTELFESPPTYQFEIGRFREEDMAFPPSVTVKDYTFGGSAGYPNPKAGAQPARFPTIIQIVPALPAAPPG